MGREGAEKIDRKHDYYLNNDYKKGSDDYFFIIAQSNTDSSNSVRKLDYIRDCRVPMLNKLIQHACMFRGLSAQLRVVLTSGI